MVAFRETGTAKDELHVWHYRCKRLVRVVLLFGQAQDFLAGVYKASTRTGVLTRPCMSTPGHLRWKPAPSKATSPGGEAEG